MLNEDVVRVFVGADRSQQLAVKVLEHSIHRHTSGPVQVFPMIDLDVKQPADPKNWGRTGFSFSRFRIPKLAGYQGKAIYLDADMLVMKDIAALWNIPFNDAKIVIQADLPEQHQATHHKYGAPTQRIKQCAVMLLDCGNLDWEVDRIIADLDQGKYTYEDLMYQFCLLQENEIRYSVPFEWNSLEYFDAETCLIHYTDMATQPWVSARNPLAYLWMEEVRLMLRTNKIRWEEIQAEVDLGYFRPSLISELKYGHYIPPLLYPTWQRLNDAYDRRSNYQPHREAYQRKKVRQQAMETGVGRQSPSIP